MCVGSKNGTICKEEFEKWEDMDSSPDIIEYPALCVCVCVCGVQEQGDVWYNVRLQLMA